MQSDGLEERIRMIAKAENALNNQTQFKAAPITKPIDYNDAPLKKMISDIERKMSETNQSMSVVQQSIQKLQTENTNLKKDLNTL